MFKILSTLLLTCLAVIPAFAEVVIIPADRDATLIEPAVYDVYPEKGCPTNAEDICANGSGPYFFTGRTNQSKFSIRRGLVRFNVAGVLPENASIDRVSLSLFQISNNEKQSVVSLHRALEDWGEGASSSTGGSGAPAELGDATWLHTAYPNQYWVQEGGYFIPDASGTRMIGGTAFYVWSSTVNLVKDVRLWLDDPQQNFGWLMMGDEDTAGSVKRFDSRQGDNSNQHPMLTIEYHLQGK
jgi:hypothetical protein